MTMHLPTDLSLAIAAALFASAAPAGAGVLLDPIASATLTADALARTSGAFGNDEQFDQQRAAVPGNATIRLDEAVAAGASVGTFGVALGTASASLQTTPIADGIRVTQSAAAAGSGGVLDAGGLLGQQRNEASAAGTSSFSLRFETAGDADYRITEGLLPDTVEADGDTELVLALSEADGLRFFVQSRGLLSDLDLAGSLGPGSYTLLVRVFASLPDASPADRRAGADSELAFRLTAVPEPGGLAALGGAAAVLVRRRRLPRRAVG